MEPLKIGISGVRGVVGDSFTTEVALNFAQAFGTYFNRRKVLVCRDTRTSGEMIKESILSGLVSTGCEVVYLKVCPTPSMFLMIKKLGADGGIIITASHNPAQWNGLKFVSKDGIFLTGTQLEKLYDIYESKNYTRVSWNKIKPIKINNTAINYHIDRVLNYIDVKVIRNRKIKVAIDPCNGAGTVITPRFLRRLGCEVVAINERPNGNFRHNPEPLPENLKQLSSLVKSKNFDVGFAQDPDADRLAIVSEKGYPIGEENTLALTIKFVLSKESGNVVVNLSTSRRIDDIAKTHGSIVIRTAIGETNVVERMKKEKAVIGGEGNGGVIYPRINFGRDSLVGIGLILQYMAESRKSISSLVSSITQYHMVKEKVTCPMDKIPKVMEEIKRDCRNRKLDLTDGIRIDWRDKWVHVRPSNTEPVIRVISEAKTDTEARRLCDGILRQVKRTIGQ